VSASTAPQNAPSLSRATLTERTGTNAPAAPVRIVHLGLGAFHRAHQAWYTAQVDHNAEWGIAAFTGRNPTAANELAPQDGLFHLVERSGTGDTASLVSSIVEANDGSDLARFGELLAAPATAIVTITVTEAGYRLDSNNLPNATDPLVAADSAALRTVSTVEPRELPELHTTLGRLVYGLHARRAAGAGPIAIVPCDNMPDNGDVVRAAVLDLAASVDGSLTDWIRDTVSFVSTSVDRITPKTTPADIDTVERLTGWRDTAVVVTEPFTDWVLSGEFPAGRPAWEEAGARFVSEIAPFESRKLWLLNGAHSLLAYTARQRGHDTVASAIDDEECRAAVTAFWNEAVEHLPTTVDLDLDGYRAALLDRFRNPRIEHRLAQIANDGVAKLRIRILPVLQAEHGRGRTGAAALHVIAGWIGQVLPGGVLDAAVIIDPAEEEIRRASALPRDEAVRALLRLIDPALAADTDLVRRVLAEVSRG
jgi:fructuronate reductase